MTPDERAAWKTRIENDNNQGMFTPPSHTKETVEMPGARGGSNWGTTAANPSKGLLYLLTQDWPSFVPEVAARSLPRSSGQYGETATGKQVYIDNCQACHGENREGNGMAPSLTGLLQKVNIDDFHTVVQMGKGEMPASPKSDPGQHRCALCLPGQSRWACSSGLRRAPQCASCLRWAI